MRQLIIEGMFTLSTKAVITVEAGEDNKKITVDCNLEYDENATDHDKKNAEELKKMLLDNIQKIVDRDCDYYPVKDVLERARKNILAIFVPGGKVIKCERLKPTYKFDPNVVY